MLRRRRPFLHARRWRLPLAAACLVAAAYTTAAPRAEAAPTVATEGAHDGQLPDALPPLDGALLNEAGAPDVIPVLQLRLRPELDVAPAFARDDSRLANTLTARAGVMATIEGLTATVVLGGGGRFGQAARRARLVDDPSFPVVQTAAARFALDVFGVEGHVALGRFFFRIADGRLIGDELFDARGRTVDGFMADAGDTVRVRAAVLFRSTSSRAVEDVAPWLATVDVQGAPLAGGLLAAYGFVADDVRARLQTPTLGARGVQRLGPAELLVGVDVQASVAREIALLLPLASAAHGEAQARLHAWDDSVYVDVRAELTAGDRVGGRVFYAPAPTQHGTLGTLDLFGMENTWMTEVGAGCALRGDFVLSTRLLAVGRVNGAQPLVNPSGVAHATRRGGALALASAELSAAWPIHPRAALDVTYAVGVPGSAVAGETFAQRVILALTVDIEGGGMLAPAAPTTRFALIERIRAPDADAALPH